MANSRIPQPDEIIVLVFGASRWPDCPKFHDAPSLERSADALMGFVRNAEGMGVPIRNIKSFFNSFDEPSEQLDLAQNFVNRRRHEYKEVGKKITDLLIYYAGHGDFERDGREFYMAIRRTQTQWPLLTSITANALGDWVRRTGQDLRTYLIIDCCFAAAAQLGFQTSPIDLAEKRLHEALPNSIESDDDIGFPSTGVALLAAAGMNDTTFAPPEEEYSRFTKHLLEALNGGDKSFPAVLSLSDIHLLVHRQVTRLYPDGARPELRSLHQTRGRVELVRLFRNLAVAGKQGDVSLDPRLARSDVNAGNTPPLQDDVPLSNAAAGLAGKPPPEGASASSATNDQQGTPSSEAADIQQAKRSWFRSNPKIPEGATSKPAGNEQPGTVYGNADEKPEQSSGKAYDMPQAKRSWFRSKPQKQDDKPSRHTGSPDGQAGNAPPDANSSDSVPPKGKPAKKARAFTARKMFAVTAIAATAILTAVLIAASNQKHLQLPTSITHSSSSTSETKQNSTSSNFPSGCWAAVSDHRFTPDKENFPVWDIYERDTTDEAANMALRLCRRASPTPSTCHVLQVGCN